MPVLRTWICDAIGCEARYEEQLWGEGAPRWGQLDGAAENGGSPRPVTLCPTHLEALVAWLNARLQK